MTELAAVSTGVIGGGQLSAFVLSAPGETWYADVWTDYALTPNRDEGGVTLSDNTTFVIESNSLDSITVAAGDMTAVASSGDSYGMLYHFENLEIRRNAYLMTNADVLVDSGDLVSDDEVTFVLADSCGLETAVLELTGVTTLDGDPVTELLLCSGCQ